MKWLIIKWGFVQHGKEDFAFTFHPSLFLNALLCFVLCLILSGCGPKLSTPDEVMEFKEAGPSQAVLDFGQFHKDKPGPYRVVPGDVLQFQMEIDLRVVSSELSDRQTCGWLSNDPYMVRVNNRGYITLPIVGDIQVAGKTLAVIEGLVKSAYYPKYVVNPPMIFCKMEEYLGEHERVFTVLGLVNKPKAYDYPPDIQYNLMEALGFAGGLDMSADPRYVKVFRQDSSGKILQATFGIGKKGITDAYRTAIKPGDMIYVDHTLGTRFNKFVSSIFRVTVGANVNALNID